VSDLALLDTLAGLMDDWLPTVTPAGRDSLTEFVGKILEALADDESLPDDMVRHVGECIFHVRDCLDRFELVGDFDLQVAVDRLYLSVSMAKTVSKHKEKWTHLAENVAYPFAVGALSAPVGNFLTQLAIGG
jgi:hypothetical protein